jgi:arsenate reductase
MAEGIVNHYFKTTLEAKSAGIEPKSLNPYAVKVMQEIGIDISNHTVNKPEDFKDLDFDYLITLCGPCPGILSAFLTQKPLKRLHWGFPDPAQLTGSEAEIMEGFRMVRDNLKAEIFKLFKTRRKED